MTTPLPYNTAIMAAKGFTEEFCFKFGILRRSISQGTHFNNELMKNLTALLGRNHIQTSTYHSQSDGLTKNFKSTFHPQLAKFQNSKLQDWDEHLRTRTYW